MKTLDEIKEDVIDSRDLIEEMEEWQGVVDDEDATEEEREDARANLDEIKEFCEPFEEYSEWEYGETIVSDDYWEEYVEGMLVDIGYLPKDLPAWLAIDWEQTAENVSQDYIYENGYYMRCF